MAALVAGVQYGLTYQDHCNENKSLIFVKLTDSALRAVEEYLKNRSKCSLVPQIQFLGSEGHLLFPNGQSPRARSSFKFSLSSNSDIEGPQGSFECIRHSGLKCVESVGSLPCKMRVQANDDVYETTRSRMQAAEKQQKENCTREIELDKTGIGRRVKGRTKMLSNGALPKRRILPSAITTSLNLNKLSANPDLLKRPLRDRIIHLLALRPYKKPELYLALNKDGVKEKDKSNFMNTLISIAVVKDNTYHLMRHIWNDVQEDWPFYSDQDRQILKRRKPENLTPPGSSDSQSPSSMMVGSPPSVTEPPKRPGYFEGADGHLVKKQRISHYKRPALGRKTFPHPSPPTPPQDPSPPSPRHPPPLSSEFVPKYLVDYTTIKDIDQRRKYKEDFNANYSEYKRLHSLVEEVSKKFTVLQEQLKKEERGSEGWQRIKNQIMREYEENNKNKRHQDAKKRFHYLHEKLSHIKRLVMEYDEKEFS